MPGHPLPEEIVKQRLRVLAQCGGDRSEASRLLKISRGAMMSTIDAAARYDIPVPPTKNQFESEPAMRPGTSGVIDIQIENGIVPIGSDAHFWPGVETAGLAAFRWFLKTYRRDLAACILNGDVVDASSLSRFPSIGWEEKPTVASELGHTQECLRHIQKAGGNQIEYYWTAGNHDLRYETKIANMIPELRGVHGIHLKDHFPHWNPCWIVRINGNVIIKHRYKGGIHAAYNNTLHAGTTIVTGHLHSLQVRPFSDYNGTRWGVDDGTLAAPYGPQFIHYTEASPVNWRSGFAVLTFRDGRLLWPELVHVIDHEHWEFRGKVYP